MLNLEANQKEQSINKEDFLLNAIYNNDLYYPNKLKNYHKIKILTANFNLPDKKELNEK